MSLSTKNDVFMTCSILIVFSVFIIYIVYRMLDYQSNPVRFREGLESANCSISDLKNKITKIKEQVEGTIDVSKNKSELEDIIGDVYDIINYKIIANLCKSTDPSSTNSVYMTNILMDNAAGLQKLMKWLDGKSGSSSKGGMFG
jgi:cell division protein FtsL